MSEATMYVTPSGTAHMHQITNYVQIKYLRVPEEIIDLVREQQQNQPPNRGRGGPQRGEGRERGRGGGRGGRGRGRGRGSS